MCVLNDEKQCDTCVIIDWFTELWKCPPVWINKKWRKLNQFDSKNVRANGIILTFNIIVKLVVWKLSFAFNIDLKESSNLIIVIQTSNINVRDGSTISLARTLGIWGVAFKNQKRASEIQLYLVVMSSSLGKICSQLEINPWNQSYALHSLFPRIPKRLHESLN